MDSAVRDGEGAGGDVVGCERAVTCARGELGDARVDLLEREPVGARYNRRDDAVVRLDRNRDVDLAQQLDPGLGHARVEPRMPEERRGDELHHDRGHSRR